MKFRTIVITKRKLTVFAAAAAACCAVIGAAAYFSARGGEIVPAFKEDKPHYEEILDEGLSNGENKFDLKKIISSLLGFNPTEPETIVKEFSPALDDAPASDGFIDNPEEPQKSSSPKIRKKMKIRQIPLCHRPNRYAPRSGFRSTTRAAIPLMLTVCAPIISRFQIPLASRLC